jgi:hypothetical protein
MSINRRNFWRLFRRPGLAKQRRPAIAWASPPTRAVDGKRRLSLFGSCEAGFSTWVVINYFMSYLDNPDGRKIDEIGVKFSLSRTARLSMALGICPAAEAARRSHAPVRFIRQFGCDHLKVNTNGRRPTGTTPQDLREMAVTLNGWESGSRRKG